MFKNPTFGVKFVQDIWWIATFKQNLVLLVIMSMSILPVVSGEAQAALPKNFNPPLWGLWLEI